MITLGIDPGLSGALAILSETGEYELVWDLPVVRSGKLSWIDGARLHSFLIEAQAGKPARCFIERVQAFPKQGLSSAFNFGVGFGSILSTLQARGIAIEFVTPAAWKKAMGLNSDKHASLDRGRLLFPAAPLELKKHEGRAEALLLAYWGFRQTIRKAA